MEPRFLGVDIGGTKCAVCLGYGSGHIIDRRAFPTRESLGPQQAIDNLFKFTDELLQQHGRRIDAIGIACGSPLDWEKGIIQAPAQLSSWKDVPIVKIFSERYHTPAFLDNDANAGALAEYCFGAGRGYQHIAFLTFGTGMGAGFVLNGQVYRGANCYAGEIGHLRLSPSGPLGCRKAGSFEGWCSGAGIAQIAAKEHANFNGRTNLSPSASAEDVGLAAEQGDPLALKVLELSGHYLGIALALILDTLNPQRIIIGSIFKRCEKFLRPAMEIALAQEALPQTIAACQIVPSELGDHVGDLAALSIAGIRSRE